MLRSVGLALMFIPGPAVFLWVLSANLIGYQQNISIDNIILGLIPGILPITLSVLSYRRTSPWIYLAFGYSVMAMLYWGFISFVTYETWGYGNLLATVVFFIGCLFTFFSNRIGSTAKAGSPEKH